MSVLVWRPSDWNESGNRPAGSERARADAFPSIEAGPGSRSDSPGEFRSAARTAPEKYLHRVAVRAGDKIVLISVSDVVWIQSYGNLIRLHLENASYEHRTTIKDACTHLNPEHFLRVHRNAIVNLDYVTEFDLPRCGNAFVHLRNGKALPISGTARMALRRGLLSQAYGSTDIGGL